MRRHLDPQELEKLAHHTGEPLQALLDDIVDFARAVLVVTFVAVFGLVALAITLAEIPGVRP